MQDQNPYTLFGITFGISSVAGLAALLRSRQKITVRLAVSAFLNAGLFGTAVAMLWYEYYGGKTHPWFMLGISLLAGLGGTTLLDFALQAVNEAVSIYAKRLASGMPVPGAGQDDRNVDEEMLLPTPEPKDKDKDKDRQP